jgi:4-alpha-glucanotransferase
MHRRAGILVPLFSVYSQKSLGIGEIADLRLLIDWATITGNSIIQLLPMNEVGFTFCPYDSLSSFALEPAYISLELLPQAKKFIDRIENLKDLFPAGQRYVDYRIKKEKINLLWEIFQEDNYDLDDFKQFKEENSYWINEFAFYKVIKNYQGGRPWYEWEDKYKNRNKVVLESFSQEHQKEINFQIWMQWQLFKQFKEIKQYAAVKKVFFKGDLPILVSRDSADVWVYPQFFTLEFAAGAPPDAYCAKGQRWGMPTNNWDAIAADEYTYLKEKLKYAQNFYDILRIDHVVGLFRIWSIPYHEPLENKGLNGFFDPADENQWKEHGRNILSIMLKNTKMLLCAEDLGVIPKICPKTLKELGVPGNDVQRWMKDWKIKHDFLEPKDYRTLSVAMLSTHDTTNWPAWYEFEAGTVDEDLFIRKCSDHRKIDYGHIKNKLFDPIYCRYGRLRWLKEVNSVDKLVDILGKKKEELKDFVEIYENSYLEKEKLWKHLNLKGSMREKADSEIVRRALEITLESNAIFCINTLIDWLYLTDIFKGDPYQYRINTPGTISDKNWSLTIPLSLEELLKHRVNKEIRSMIAASGRI